MQSSYYSPRAKLLITTLTLALGAWSKDFSQEIGQRNCKRGRGGFEISFEKEGGGVDTRDWISKIE